MTVGNPNIGTIVEPLAPHSGVKDFDAGPLTEALRRIDTKRAVARKSAETGYSNLLSQQFAGKWAKQAQEKYQPLLDKYAELSASGINDPLTDTSPEARALQQEISDWRTSYNQSQLATKHLMEVGKQLSVADPGTYEDESVARATGLAERDFSELLDAELAFPEKAQPLADLLSVTQSFSKGFSARNNGINDPNKLLTESYDMVTSADPSLSASLDKYIERNPQKKQEWMDAAATAQVPDVQGNGMRAAALADMTQKQMTPFDMGTFQSDVISSVDPRNFSNDDYSNVTSKREIASQLETAGMLRVDADPRVLRDPQFMAVAKIDADDTEKEARTKARAYFKGLVPLVKGQVAMKRTDSSTGNTTDEELAGEERWQAAFTSGDPALIEKAIGFVGSTGDIGMILPEGALKPGEKVVAVSGETMSKAGVEQGAGQRTGDKVYHIQITDENADSGRFSGDQPEPTRTITVKGSDLDMERALNMYRKAAKSSGREFGTSETGATVPAVAPPISPAAKPKW